MARALTVAGATIISTGVVGYPMEEAARVALKTVMEAAPRLRSVRRIRFVLGDEGALRVHEAVLEGEKGSRSQEKRPS